MRFKRAFHLSWAMLFMAGCASVPAGKSVVSDLAAKPDASELEFWHTLETRSMATNDDAFHGLLIFTDGDDPCASYADRVATLKQRGMLPRDFNAAGDDALERGTLAVALVKVLHLKGGLSMQLFGDSPRYALRELVYRRLFPESSEQQLFSGADLLGVIGRVEDYREGDPANVPAKVLYVGAQPTPALSEEAASDAIEYPSFLSTAMANFSLLQPATSEPASQPAPIKLPDGPLKLVITGVRGKAEVRVPPDEKWAKAEANEELGEGAELRTGLKSAVQLQIRPDQTITVDRLGVVKIDRATLAAGKFVTSVSMSYGRTRYDIDAANREYDATVRSPNSTLGIRGTRVSLLDQRPFPPEAVSLTGTAQFRNLRRQLVAVGRRGQGKTKIVGGQSNAAEFALGEAVVDPVVANARTQSEQPLIASLLSRGAVFEFDRDLGIPIVRGGIPPTDAELQATLPGNLDFTARWNTDVNFDLIVATPGTDANIGGETIFAAPGFTKSPSGGILPFDHRGGANGGIELVHWDTTNYPTGFYTIGATNASNQTAHVRINAYLDKKKYDGENSPLGSSLNDFLIEEGVAKRINGGYEGDVAPGLSLLILYDVQNAPGGSTSTQAVTSKQKTSASALKVQGPMPKAIQGTPLPPVTKLKTR